MHDYELFLSRLEGRSGLVVLTDERLASGDDEMSFIELGTRNDRTGRRVVVLRLEALKKGSDGWRVIALSSIDFAELNK